MLFSHFFPIFSTYKFIFTVNFGSTWQQGAIMNRRNFLKAASALAAGSIACQSKIINILLLSGKNNHDWQKTTPAIQSILENTGHFLVTVTENPEKLKPEELDQYDVIMSNWNTWPDVTGQRWNPELEKAFLAFVAKGKGVVIIHAGSSTLQDWPEFQQIAGGSWELGSTGHGPVHTFKVSIENSNHPITKGLEDFYIRDELWHRTKFHPGVKVLCSAYSSPEKKGTGQNEPVTVTTQYEKGRCCYFVLGHDTSTMQNIAWQTIMLRATEWAATGKASFPMPNNWPVNKEMAQSDNIK